MQSLARKINNLVGITALGQQLKADSLPVVLATDQDILSVEITQPYRAIHIDGATLAASPVTNYTAGDSVGNKITLTSFSELKASMLQSIMLQAASVGTGTWDMDILIFNSNPSASTFVDDSAAIIAAGDYMKVDAIIPIVDGDWVTIAGRKYCLKTNIGAVVNTDSTAYAAIVSKAVFDGPANNLEITFGVLQG